MMDRLFKSTERPFLVGLILIHTRQCFKVTKPASDWLLNLAPVCEPNYLVRDVECKSNIQLYLKFKNFNVRDIIFGIVKSVK